MIVVRLRSGLDNQMFQYAFFLQLRKWHGESNVLRQIKKKYADNESLTVFDVE